MTTMKDDYDRLVEAVRCIVSTDAGISAMDRMQRPLSEVSYVAFKSPNRLYVAIQVDSPRNDRYSWLVHTEDGFGRVCTTWETTREVAEMENECVNQGMVDVSDEVALIYSTFRL